MHVCSALTSDFVKCRVAAHCYGNINKVSSLNKVALGFIVEVGAADKSVGFLRSVRILKLYIYFTRTV